MVRPYTTTGDQKHLHFEWEILFITQMRVSLLLGKYQVMVQRVASCLSWGVINEVYAICRHSDKSDPL